MDKLIEKLITLRGELAELEYRKTKEWDNQSYLEGRIVNVKRQIEVIEKMIENQKEITL